MLIGPRILDVKGTCIHVIRIIITLLSGEIFPGARVILSFIILYYLYLRNLDCGQNDGHFANL